MKTVVVNLISLKDCVSVPISDEEAWILELGSEMSKSSVLSLICGRAREQYLSKVNEKLDRDLQMYFIKESLAKKET